MLRRQLGKPTARPLWPAGLDEPDAFDPVELQAAHDAARRIWRCRRDEILQRLDGALPQMKANIYSGNALNAAAEAWDLVLRDADAPGARISRGPIGSSSHISFLKYQIEIVSPAISQYTRSG